MATIICRNGFVLIFFEARFPDRGMFRVLALRARRTAGALAVAFLRAGGDNRHVTIRVDNDAESGARGPFVHGAIVLVLLGNPREKYWGMLLELSSAGLSLRGIDLNSFDDFVSLLRTGEAANAADVFFPMHRLERIEIDLPSGDVPSLAERFQTATGCSATMFFGQSQDRSVQFP